MSPEEIELKIRQVAEEYSKLNYPGRYDAHVRVFVKQDSPFINNFKDAIALYDRVRWEYKLDTDKKQTDTVMVDTFKKYVAVQYQFVSYRCRVCIPNEPGHKEL
jgi:hypothetical protein